MKTSACPKCFVNDCRFSNKSDKNLMLVYLTIMEDKSIDRFPTPSSIKIIKNFSYKRYKP